MEVSAVDTVFDLAMLYVSFHNLFTAVYYLMPINIPIKKPFLRWSATSKVSRRCLLLSQVLNILNIINALRSGVAIYYQDSTSCDCNHQVRVLLTFVNILGTLLTTRMFQYLLYHPDKVIEIEEAAITKEILTFRPPPLSALESALGLYNFIFEPEFFGLENVPDHDHRLLFVCNHALLGYEMPLLIYNLYKKRKMFVRGLADHFHFYLPLWANLLKAFGAVDGTREHCDLLMETNEPILVYPGGGREVLKKSSDEKYSLFWKDRTGFARHSIKHGYTIVPVSTVGTEDMFDVMYDLPVGWLFGGSSPSRKDLSYPVVKPPGPSKLQRVYFRFGKPIPTSHMERNTSPSNCEEIRDLTRDAIIQGIEEMKKRQDADPMRLTVPRLRSKLAELFKSFGLTMATTANQASNENNQETEEHKHKHHASHHQHHHQPKNEDEKKTE
eukprot:TRINITY_DN9263_c0_g1::TRINITY_DN9263_c0_g1_i1::g.13251::m.13251 TRINITY_DN9263_c0_g1::TRINITY_DN9263_c0_g1_i1::g.13251  ORF type:complete len:468 (+),score=80.33,sp/Q9LW26/Y3684_ARATH/27.84/1e-16,DAGAT/PF03982.8/1e-09,Acyltransferase/PF01553.16/1.8e-06,Zip/PF02535.17/0.13,Peptidase_S49_N/PF08496.5/4.2 TRINITY_DN9263_c0_g1_i1:81-1406(+)